MNNNPNNESQSIITEVTVFSDRAQITRELTQELEKGEHSIVFSDLPESIEEKSIQASGLGKAIIRDVKFKKEFFSDYPDDKLQQINNKKETLEEEIREINDKINRVNNEKKFIEKIASSLTDTRKTKKNIGLDPDKWMKFTEFYRSKMESLDTENRENNKIKKAKNNELKKIQSEIDQISGQFNKLRNKVQVLLEVSEAGKVSINLSYIVYGPSWLPYYDLRVSSKNKTMSIAYNAIIRQDTTEEWNDVSLKLSTAQPQISGTPPELTPWRISEKLPPMPQPQLRQAAYSHSLDKSKKAPVAAPEVMMDLELAVMEEAEPEEVRADPFEVAEATAQTGATSVVFAASGKNSINNDNSDHRVTVMLFDFPAQFQYSSTPKLEPFAYLKAKVKNETEFPFLKGQSNIFLDNNFVANSELKQVAPSEEFWTSLGIDQSIRVEHKFIKKYQSQEGIFNKTNKFIYEYLFIITNNKKTEEEIIIKDQIPISGQEKIIVNLIEPGYKSDSDKLKKDELNILSWFMKLKPGEKLEIPFKFSVEYPREMLIAGLE